MKKKSQFLIIESKRLWYYTDIMTMTSIKIKVLIVTMTGS